MENDRTEKIKELGLILNIVRKLTKQQIYELKDYLKNINARDT